MSNNIFNPRIPKGQEMHLSLFFFLNGKCILAYNVHLKYETIDIMYFIPLDLTSHKLLLSGQDWI
jgi:hypothetical protein